MSSEMIPAPAAVNADSTPTTPAAPAETASTAEQTTTPQLEKAAGSETEQPTTATEDGQPEKQPTPGELARKERNRERWREMKETVAQSKARERALIAEIDRLQKTSQPDYSQITDPDDILAEKTAHRLRQGQVEDTKARVDQERRVSEAALNEAWAATLEDMRAKTPDFDTVVNERTPIHERAAPFIVESEKGGEIAYWLGKNPDAAKALYDKFDTAPAQALIELGRIEARLSAPVAKTVSTTPKPAPVLNGGMNPIAFDARTAGVADIAAQLRKAGVIH